MSSDKDEKLSVQDEDVQRNDTEAEEGAESTEPEELATTLSNEELAELLSKAKDRDVFLEELRRSKAELDNLQKRHRRDRVQLEKQAVCRVLVGLLPVVDNFERALATLEPLDDRTAAGLEEGFRLIYQQLGQFLEQQGVTEIIAAGEVFNPELHEAVAQQEVVDRPSGEIVAVLEKGYMHDAVVLRPSRVQVALNVAEKSAVPDTFDEAAEVSEAETHDPSLASEDVKDDREEDTNG